MDTTEYITLQEVKRVCKELGLQDWTALSEAKVDIGEAQRIQQALGGEALLISAEAFQFGLEVELEHGMQFPDTNVTNNHPILTGKIVVAHLKESLDYYERLNIAELEGDMLKASLSGKSEKLTSIYRKLVEARAKLAEMEKRALP